MAQKRKIDYQPEFLSSLIIPTAAGTGKLLTSNSEGKGEWATAAGSTFSPGVGTPNTTEQSLTASEFNVISGTSVALATESLIVGSRYKFHIGLIKTAAGTAAWKARIAFGTADTKADGAVATWTSGTNTAAIDQAELSIIVSVTKTGSSAEAACLAIYTNTLTNATGLGVLKPIPGSTATFNSTLTNPFLHVDIEPGASAVITGYGYAMRLA